MHLTDSQKRHLRGLAHRLRPCVYVGNAGPTPGVLAEINAALDYHELIKVSVRTGSRETRDATIGTLQRDARATLVQQIGNTAVLYRPRDGDRKIGLPEAGPGPTGATQT